MSNIEYTAEQINNLTGNQAYAWARNLNNQNKFYNDDELRENPHNALIALLGLNR